MLDALFQFPQSERVNCNLMEQVTAQGKELLSVSTIGTSELQPDEVVRRARSFLLSVSTIGTSELQQTFPQDVEVLVTSFSFHNRNE